MYFRNDQLADMKVSLNRCGLSVNFKTDKNGKQFIILNNDVNDNCRILKEIIPFAILTNGNSKVKKFILN